MNVRNLSSLLFSFLTLVVLGCGGGGGSAGSAGPATVTKVSGEASKGPIVGGDVKIFAINADGSLQSTPLATTPATVTTNAPFGNYSAKINYAGPVKVVVTGGIYKDEATGTDVNFAGKSLSAVVANVTGSSKVSVTPYTDMAAKKAGTTLTPAKIAEANKGIADALNLNGVDIIAETPSTSDKYKFALAVISQAAGADATKVADLLTKTAEAIDVTTGTIKDSPEHNLLVIARTAAYTNVKINPTGTIPGVDGNAVSGVTLTASPLTGAINAPVTISASVTKISGGAVADGTFVTFATSAGSITASATTVGGIATATLSGVTTVQNVSVTAKAGTSTSLLTVAFVNPNAPTAITVTANPTNGVVGTPVAIGAAVTRAAGGAVPDGTSVAFVVTSGSGTLSAATATTTAGIATVNLTGSAAGTVVVTATAGTVSAIGSVPFIIQPTLVTVKLATSGTLPVGRIISGIQAIVTATPSAGLSILPADVTTSGVSVGSLLTPNTTNVAAVNLALINVSGIQVGEFATLNYHVAPGTFPVAGNFGITPVSVIDVNGAIPGVTVIIQSVTIQ